MVFGLKTIPCACSVLPYDLWTVGGIKALISVICNITTFIKVDVRESFVIKSAVTKKEAVDMRYKCHVESLAILTCIHMNAVAGIGRSV
jgi:hypothetical protein